MFFNTNPSDTTVVLGLNAGKATVRGFELEALWQPTEDLSFTFDYTYLDPKHDEVIVRAGTIFDPAVNTASPYQVGQNIKNLFRVSYAPENSVNVGARWTFLKFGSNDLSAILNYRWEDRTYFTETTGDGVPGSDLYSRPDFGLLDGRLSWKMEFANESRARVDLWGKNLTDKKWPTHIIGLGVPVAAQDPFTGVVTQPGYVASATAWAERRTYGINLVYEF